MEYNIISWSAFRRHSTESEIATDPIKVGFFVGDCRKPGPELTGKHWCKRIEHHYKLSQSSLKFKAVGNAGSRNFLQMKHVGLENTQYHTITYELHKLVLNCISKQLNQLFFIEIIAY